MLNRPDHIPVAPRKKHLHEAHGDIREDDYYWLNDHENAEVIDYLNAENHYKDEVLASTKDLQETIYNEIVGRIPKDDESVPYKLRGYHYYFRFEKELEYPIYCRRKDEEGSVEEIMLDVNEMANGHSYYEVNALVVSPDSQWLAFGEDTVSRRMYTLRFKNLASGEMLNISIPNTTGSVAWAADNNTFFYTQKDDSLRPNKVMRSRLGEVPDSAVEIFEEKDPTFVCYAYKSKSERYIMIGCSATLSNEIWFLDADNPTGNFKVVQPRINELEYAAAHFDDHFYITTNKNGATNFCLMKTPVDKPGMENWEMVIPHREDTLLEDIEIFRDYLVVEERSKGLSQLQVRPWNGEPYYLTFEEETYTVSIGTNPDFDSEVLRYGYGSLTQPAMVWDFNMRTKEAVLLKQKVVEGVYDAHLYASKRIFAKAADGEQIAISLVYRKDTFKHGKSPCLIYGYGSYGHTIDPVFGVARLSLLDRGFVFAIAHIRGGQYYGRRWYDQGRMLNKMNTFTDFVACSRELVAEGFSAPDLLFAMGGSAGGLLMGAVVNINPELYKGVIAAVPFVDVVTTMMDDSIPLTTGEYDEWGNPNVPEYYHYIKSYSPYDNVKAQQYPHMLVTTGLHDSQVQYWEPAKWVARLRMMKTDNNFLLMHCNMDTGHGGASGRFAYHRETAMEYAFLLALLEEK
jgi:oligopeptidase B